MRILLAFIHYPISSGSYFKRALRRLGHDARSLGPSTENVIWGINVDPRHAQSADYPNNYQLGLPFPTMQEFYALRELSGWQPELIITSDSAYTITGEAPCPHVLFGADNHVRNYRNLEAEGARFGAMFFCHSWGARIGEPGVYWLPPGYDPEAHTDLGQERPMDVMLIGYPYAERLALAQALQASGLRCMFTLGPLWDAYNQAYNQAKIALVKAVRDDLTQRFFENMAQGCCVLADRTVDAGLLGFEAGVDYWPYANVEQAVREARYLLESGHWQVIAANGKRKVSQGHSWDVRANTLLNTIGFTQEWGYGMHPIMDLTQSHSHPAFAG